MGVVAGKGHARQDWQKNHLMNARGFVVNVPCQQSANGKGGFLLMKITGEPPLQQSHGPLAETATRVQE